MGIFFHIALPILVSIGVCSFLRTKTITAKVINVSAQTSGSPVSLMANTTDFPNPATVDRHIAKGTPTSSPDRDANNASFTGKLEVSVNEEPIYATIAMELETGSTDKGLWTRLFAECSGDEKQMKVLYIKQRAERLISAKCISVEKIVAEKANAERIASEKIAAEKTEAERIAADKVMAHPAYCPGCKKIDAYRAISDKIFCPHCKIYVAEYTAEKSDTERIAVEKANAELRKKTDLLIENQKRYLKKGVEHPKVEKTDAERIAAVNAEIAAVKSRI